MSVEIRSATTEDAKALLLIYAYYVKNTAVSFECDVPTEVEFKKRIETTLKKYPYIVAQKDGKVIGYAYAGCFRARAAYSHCCEVSVYVDKNEQKKGIGRMLYEKLEEILLKKGFENCYACVTFPKEKDEFLNTNSRDFHFHMGYSQAGYFNNCGKKFGKYFDMIYMEKILR